MFGPGEPNETTLAAAGGRDAFVARYAPDGTLARATRDGGGGTKHGLGVAALPDGSAMVTGRFRDTAAFGPGEANETDLTSAGFDDVLLAKRYPWRR